MFNNKTIFFAALDWGLGHASRSISVINQLPKNNKIILGVTPLTKLIYNEVFPDLQQINLPAYNIRYSTTFPLWLKLLSETPRIKKIIKNEYRILDKIIEQNKIDVVISDNRFGLYSDKVHSVFITHQLNIKAPIFTRLINRINKRYILKFNEVWVPDYEDESKSLSGELSHAKTLFHSRVKYIGPQSRLNLDDSNAISEIKYDYLILLSGPEPAREKLEKRLIKKAKASNKKIALVRGSAFKNDYSELKNTDVFDLPGNKKLTELILSSRKIICRSGYSTLMDMYLLQKKDLILIPTPGQSEQAYLAAYWAKKFDATLVNESDINQLVF